MMEASARNFVFCLTTGRSGTAFLTELLAANLPDAECHHEFLGWGDFGLRTPDVSHMTLFNSEGNVEKVQNFWRDKLAIVLNGRLRFYVETAHMLMKAGLVENIASLTRAGHVHLIDLQRDPAATIQSFKSRLDFFNQGNQWLWYLDHTYPRNLSGWEKFKGYGHSGLCLWYIVETRLRAAYYARLTAGDPNISVHRVRLEELNSPAGAGRLLAAMGVTIPQRDIQMPPPQNVGTPLPASVWEPGEKDRLPKLVAAAQFDADALARIAIEQGRGFQPALHDEGGIVRRS
jgi:hypothetical protein